MKFRTTLILLVVLVALAGYLFWSSRAKPATTDASNTADVHVLSFNPQDVNTITIRDASGKEVRAEQSGTTWRLTAPTNEAADTERVTNNIGYLSKLVATQVITPPTPDLAPYGLAKPAFIFQLSKGQSVVAELHIGNKNPDGSATYVQSKGAPVVYLVTDTVVGNVMNWLTAPPIPPTPVPTPSPAAPATTATP